MNVLNEVKICPDNFANSAVKPCKLAKLQVGWLVGFWCTHFRDSAPLINLAPLINSVI